MDERDEWDFGFGWGGFRQAAEWQSRGRHSALTAPTHARTLADRLPGCYQSYQSYAAMLCHPRYAAMLCRQEVPQ